MSNNRLKDPAPRSITTRIHLCSGFSRFTAPFRTPNPTPQRETYTRLALVWPKICGETVEYIIKDLFIIILEIYGLKDDRIDHFLAPPAHR